MQPTAPRRSLLRLARARLRRSRQEHALSHPVLARALARVAEGVGIVVYSGEVTPEHGYRELARTSGSESLLGGAAEDGDQDAAFERALHPDDREAYHSYPDWESLAEPTPSEVEYRLVGLDGVTRWVWDRHIARRGPDRTILYDGIVTDVTDRHRLAAELIETQSLLGRALEATASHVYSGEYVDGGYREIYTGPGDGRLLGGEPPAGVDRAVSWLGRIHPDDRAHHDASFTHIPPGGTVDFEYRLCGYDGVVRWMWDRAVCREVDGRLIVQGVVTDVTERRAERERLVATQRRLDAVLGSIDEVLYEIEFGDGLLPQLRYISVGADELLGGRPPEGGDAIAAWNEAVHPDDRAAYRIHLAELAAGRPSSMEYRVRGLDGAERWIWAQGKPREEDGRRVAAGILADVTEQHRLADQLRRARDEAERRARSDSLTDAHNRRHLSEALERELAPGRRPAVLLIDLDHFKPVNDRLGHRSGDEVLIAVAARIRSAVGPGDTVARWGGEEFAVLAPDVDDDASLRALAEAVRRSIAQRAFETTGGPVRMTASVGAARADGSVDASTLVDAADGALYAAKRQGRNRTRLWSDLREGDLLPEDPEVLRLAEALAGYAGAREGLPEHHAAAVAGLAATLAERLGLSPAAITRCRLGGWLHDAGKVAMPESILTKPAPLAPHEWEIMRTHPAIGEQIVQRIPALASAAAAVRHHHERWDGTGYPDGLAGEGIPIEARVVAAVDAYDAMTSDRPYRDGMPFAEAVAELRRMAGRHLDPQVVETLVELLGEQETGSAAA